jgi:hypothetical protein
VCCPLRRLRAIAHCGGQPDGLSEADEGISSEAVAGKTWYKRMARLECEKAEIYRLIDARYEQDLRIATPNYLETSSIASAVALVRYSWSSLTDRCSTRRRSAGAPSGRGSGKPHVVLRQVMDMAVGDGAVARNAARREAAESRVARGCVSSNPASWKRSPQRFRSRTT